MNYAIVFWLQSVILSIVAGAFALCLPIAWLWDHQNQADLSFKGFSISLVLTIGLALIFRLISRKGNKALHTREAMTVIGLGWILASLVGALPYLLIIPNISLAGAFFESASGLTTTGASVLSDLENLPHSLHFWRSISQWMGGLGVVVFFVAIMPSLGAGAKVLFSRESSAQAADLDTSRIQEGVRRFVAIYLVLSTGCFFAYWACGLTPFDALLHMFTTLSTGGFSTRSASLLAFNNPALEWTAILFMAIGGTSFILISEAICGNQAKLRQNSELRAYSLILLGSTLLIILFLYLGDEAAASFLDNLRIAAFQVVSIMTTTGFATADYNQWLPVTHILLLTLMFVGGCSGSTAGGAKVIRWVVWSKIFTNSIEQAYRRHVVRPLYVNAKPLRQNNIDSIATYLILLMGVFMASVLIMAFLEPSISFPGTVSAVAACLFNIGPGVAEFGPTYNFAGLHDHTKGFLSIIMIMGRLELLAILVLFSPALWRRY